MKGRGIFDIGWSQPLGSQPSSVVEGLLVLDLDGLRSGSSSAADAGQAATDISGQLSTRGLQTETHRGQVGCANGRSWAGRDSDLGGAVVMSIGHRDGERLLLNEPILAAQGDS